MFHALLICDTSIVTCVLLQILDRTQCKELSSISLQALRTDPTKRPNATQLHTMLVQLAQLLTTQQQQQRQQHDAATAAVTSRL
jgi:hypothetical protein